MSVIKEIRDVLRGPGKEGRGGWDHPTLTVEFPQTMQMERRFKKRSEMFICR